MSKLVTVKAIPLGPTTSRLGYEARGFTRVPGTGEGIRALADPLSGRPCHGLDYKIPNPKYNAQDAEKLGEEYLVPKEITKRQELEERTNYNLADNSEFWHTFKVKLTDGDNIFNLDRPDDDIKYHILRASKRVANSMLEFNAGKWPNADWVIENSEEETELKEKQQSTKVQAFVKLNELGPTEKRQVARILSLSLGNATDKFVSVALGDFVEKNPQAFLTQVNKPKERIAVESLVKEAVETQVLRIRDKRHYRGNPDSGAPIGMDFESTVSFLASPKNSDIRRSIEDEVQAKKDAMAGIKESANLLS